MSHPFTIDNILTSLYNDLAVTLKAIGFGGSGVGVIKFLKHMPPPLLDNRWRGGIFDMLQDMVSNARVGERRLPDGTIVQLPQPLPIQAKQVQVPAAVEQEAAVAEPPPQPNPPVTPEQEQHN